MSAEASARAGGMVTPSPWWSRERHADRRPFLMDRNRIKAAIRKDFEEKGFIEVECAALQRSPGNETHLHAFPTDAVGADGARSRLYLHTSPEFASKKLLAAGEHRIFDFARVFRNRERVANKTEMLVFITPKMITDRNAAR